MSFWKSKFSIAGDALRKIDPLSLLLWLGSGLGWLCCQIRNAYTIEKEVDSYLEARDKAKEASKAKESEDSAE